MALNIKNPEVERLAAEIAELTGESKTEAIRRALEERRGRIRLRRSPKDRTEEDLRWLEREVWSKLPRGLRGRSISKADRERALGYGKDGV